MKKLLEILHSEKTNFGKLELVSILENEMQDQYRISSIKIPVASVKHSNNAHIVGLILDEIKTKPTWGKNQLKDLFLDKILDNL